MLVWVYTWCPFSGATKLRWHPGHLSALLFLSWGERSVKAQRNTYSGLPCLWWGNGIVINFGSFSSFLLRKKPTSLWGITATGFICAQVGVFPPLVCTQIYSPRAWEGGGCVCWHQADIRQLVCGFAAPLPPLSSCSCVCFLLSHVLTLLSPPGSWALCLADLSRAMAKEKPLGSWHSPLPRGHAGESGVG